MLERNIVWEGERGRTRERVFKDGFAQLTPDVRIIVQEMYRYQNLGQNRETSKIIIEIVLRLR